RRKTIVARPLELELAAGNRDRKERDERIGSDRGRKVGAEDLLAVIGANKELDYVAQLNFTRAIRTITGLHRVRDQRLDLDHLAAPCACRQIDKHTRHFQSPSTQAARVTITSASSDQNEPSLISAIAITI